MDQKQKDLLIDFTYKHFGDDATDILTTYPLTGPGGIRRMLGEIDPEYFCKTYLPDQFEREFADYSRTIIYTLKSVIESDSREKQAIIAPREHGKSTFSSFAMPTWAACYEKKKFIFFISSNGDISANFLEKTKKALESLAITEDFGSQKGKAWNADTICTTKGVWISCSGWKSGLRGINKDTRPDLIILDDLEDKAVMESDSLRTKLETCFNEEIGRLGTYNTDMFYIGTLLSDDSLLAKVKKMPSWKTLVLQRVISFPDDEGETLWEEWRKIYRDISNDNRFEDAYEFYLRHKEEMIKGAKVLWEDKVPADKTKYPGGYYNVMLDREAFGEDAFWKEDQSEPRNSSERPFKKISYWEEWPEKIQKLKLCCDPSEGKGDSSAYIIGGALNGGYFIKDAKLAKHNPYQIMDEIIRFCIEYPQIEEVFIESNLFKDLLKTELEKKLREIALDRKIDHLFYVRVTCEPSTINKEIRILKMEADITGEKILFNKLNIAFNEEVKAFSIKPKAKHDDAPDAVQMLWKRLKVPDYNIY